MWPCHNVFIRFFVSAPGFSPLGDLRGQPCVFSPRCASLVDLSHRPQQIISLPPPRCSIFPPAIHHEVRRQIKNVAEGESGM